ncbi:MAG: hypothetical protein QOF69_3408 [Solirubrobacteraceae bacterium]|jgi:hypothetical protein|nr:hypothetical protein [Solirubrobacteraceae bacterium]
MATINVHPTFFPLAFLLFLFPPRVEVDGGPPQPLKWRADNPLQVTPGAHHVVIYFPYMVIVRRAGEAAIDVNVAEGQTVTVTYKAPWLVFLAGKISAA